MRSMESCNAIKFEEVSISLSIQDPFCYLRTKNRTIAFYKDYLIENFELKLILLFEIIIIFMLLNQSELVLQIIKICEHKVSVNISKIINISFETKQKLTKRLLFVATQLKQIFILLQHGLFWILNQYRPKFIEQFDKRLFLLNYRY